MTTLRYNRENFFGTMTNSDNQTLTDPIDFSFQAFSDFMRNKDVKVRRLSESDEKIPDLISFQEYGTHEFWWVICFINKIQDPLNELEAGLEIAIPFIRDIEEFRQNQASSISRGQSVTLR